MGTVEFWGLVRVIGAILSVFIGILVVASVYAAQKWAHRCYLELRKLNERLTTQ